MTIANIHASCVSVGGRGVLLLGASGQGKSDLALRLMDEGALLVADDRTEIYVGRGLLRARPPKSIAGLLEVRGLGIVAGSFCSDTILALAVRLDPPAIRLPKPAFFNPPSGLKPHRPVPLIRLDGGVPSAPARIRMALKAFAKNLIRNDDPVPLRPSK